MAMRATHFREGKLTVWDRDSGREARAVVEELFDDTSHGATHHGPSHIRLVELDAHLIGLCPSQELGIQKSEDGGGGSFGSRLVDSRFE
jgi:hypothetical protein